MKAVLTIAAVALLTSAVKLPKLVKKQFTYVPSGTTILQDEERSVQSFYMSKTEVTNAQYNEFLKSLNKNGTEAEKKAARVRNENWLEDFKNPMAEYAKNYSTHEAYQSYPVVNVTYEGAQLYCEWLEKQINASWEGKKIEVRLPNHAEFIRAGAGDNPQHPYAWDDVYLREPQGDFRANCQVIRQNQITRDASGEIVVVKPLRIDGAKNRSVDLTAPSESYEAYSYGFHNMNGNVAEMISESGVAVGGSFNDFGNDIQLKSRSEYDGSSVYVGFRPVFTIVGEE